MLLYGIGSWALTEATMKKIKAFVMWLYRRMLRVSWTEHVTNAKILRMLSKEKKNPQYSQNHAIIMGN
jgi:uncharacterized protein YggT (Ycf19 family)